MENEKERKKPTDEEGEYQKRLSQFLENILKSSNGIDPSTSLELLHNQVSEDHELLEYMNSDPMGWTIVAYVIDKKDTSRRLSKLLDVVGIKLEPKVIGKEVKSIESLQIKIVLDKELKKYMVMAQLKKTLSGAMGEEGSTIFNPEVIKKNLRS